MKEIQNQLFDKPSEPIEVLMDSESDAFRMKRQQKVIDNSLEKFIGVVQKHKIKTEALYIEIEELKAIRESLKADLQETLNQEMGRITPKLIQELKSSMHQQMTESLKTNAELVQKIQMEAENTTSAINTLGEQNKRWFLHQGLLLVATVCFSCFAMGSGLFYFFPQQQYVRYEMTAEQAKQMLFGKSLLDNFKKLKQDAQKLIVDGIEIDIKQMENKPVSR